MHEEVLDFSGLDQNEINAFKQMAVIQTQAML